MLEKINHPLGGCATPTAAGHYSQPMTATDNIHIYTNKVLAEYDESGEQDLMTFLLKRCMALEHQKVDDKMWVTLYAAIAAALPDFKKNNIETITLATDNVVRVIENKI